MKFCPYDKNMLIISQNPNVLSYVCRTCGHTETDDKGGLILEMNVQQRSSEGYKILLNEFTKYDPTLPHMKTIKCPSGDCPTNKGEKERDIIYMKYDPVNLKYIYICNVCDHQWRSRS